MLGVTPQAGGRRTTTYPSVCETSASMTGWLAQIRRPLTLALVVAAGGVSLAWTWAIVTNKQFGVDLLIPLQAADRWRAGGQPYLPSAFEANVGHD